MMSLFVCEFSLFVLMKLCASNDIVTIEDIHTAFFYSTAFSLIVTALGRNILFAHPAHVCHSSFTLLVIVNEIRQLSMEFEMTSKYNMLS